MKRRFKLKISGESPRSLLIAYVLSKLKCDVYIYDYLIDSYKKKDYQLFLFSNSSKYILSKFDIWNEIEDISYDFTSLSIKDNIVSEQLLLSTENLCRKNLNTIGWTAKYSDIESLLINKCINSNNVYFISKNQFIEKSFIFDFEINFNNYDTKFNLFKLPLTTFKRIDEQLLIFNVYLRGHDEKRLYEINTTKGLFVLTPLNKNLYQVIWNKPSSQIQEIALHSKSFFLDNLSSLLPNELKIDQIIGDINLIHATDHYTIYFTKSKSIYFNENKINSNTIYDFNFDIIIRNILRIYNFLEKNQSKNTKILNKLGFFYLLRKYSEIEINLTFANYFIYLLKVNNIFSLLFRKLLFTLLKRINLIRILVLRNLHILNNKKFS